MLLALLVLNIFWCITINCQEIPKVSKPYLVLPFPLELPNRNDRSEQCWLRIEDIELSETLTVYCYIAQAFLRRYIRDYNNRKITEDEINVSLWREDPIAKENVPMPGKSESGIVDYRLTTIKDPITNQRLYVTKNAHCKLIMYSREGMTSYQVQCDKILYYVNFHSNRASRINNVHVLLIMFIVSILNSVI